MAATKENELKTHLKIALEEIGKITPWFDKKVNCWVFEHPNYPVSCGEETSEEVITKYPLYLKEFINHRLNEHLDPLVAKTVKGKGGARVGAGRPQKEVKTITKTIRLTEGLYEAACWLRSHPEALPEVKKLMRKYA